MPKKFKYIFEGTDIARYRYEVYADSDDAALSTGVYYPYFKEVIAEGGDEIQDLCLISKEVWDEESQLYIPYTKEEAEKAMTEGKFTRVVREQDLTKQLHELYEDCLNRKVGLDDGMPRLIKWANRYEEVTGTQELSSFLFPYYHIGGVLMSLCRIARNDTRTIEQRLKEIQVATSALESTPSWYWKLNEVYYPMDFWDFFGLVGKVSELITKDWFRKTIERTEWEEEIEQG